MSRNTKDRQRKKAEKEKLREEQKGPGALHWSIVTGALVVIVAILGVLFYQCYQTVEKLDGKIAELTDTVNDVVQATNKLGKENAAAEKSNVQESQTDKKAAASAARKDTAEDTPKADAAEKSTAKTDSAQKGTELLEEQLQSRIGDLSASNGNWAVYVKDLASGEDFSIQDGKMEAASLIKLYIMGTVYERYEKIQAAGTPKEDIDSLLTDMITVSDNDAANRLVTKLGDGDAQEGMKLVNTFCQVHSYGDTSMGRMLLESNPEKDNYTSVSDCGKFMDDIYGENLEASGQMQELLKQQERREKIPKGVPEGVTVGNKTGELLQVENDAAIVYAQETPYIFCVMTGDLRDADSARTAIAQMSDSIYGYFNQSRETALDKLGE